MSKSHLYYYFDGSSSRRHVARKQLYLKQYFHNQQLCKAEYFILSKEVEPNKTVYYKDGGVIHRDDGPAIEYLHGSKEYWVEGKLHRLDGPAIELCDGGREYWVKGKRHRLDGPAIEYADGTKYYYVEDKLHRLDGPAVEYPFGYKQYWVNGVDVTDKIKNIKEEDIPRYLRILSV